MGLTDEQMRLIKERKRLVETFIPNPKFTIDNQRLEDDVWAWRTNNFLQHSLSFNLGYDYSAEKWQRLKADEDGYLRARVSLHDREFEETTLLNWWESPATSLLVAEGVDISLYSMKTLLIATDQNMTIYPQFSHDNDNWFDWCDAAGTAINWNVNAVKKAIAIDDIAHYFRVVVGNYTSNIGHVTVVLDGAV